MARVKRILSNGRELTVREIGPVEFTLTATTQPLPLIDIIETAAAAHERVKALMETGRYTWTK